jgi:hypothetical protein
LRRGNCSSTGCSEATSLRLLTSGSIWFRVESRPENGPIPRVTRGDFDRRSASIRGPWRQCFGIDKTSGGSNLDKLALRPGLSKARGECRRLPLQRDQGRSALEPTGMTRVIMGDGRLLGAPRSEDGLQTVTRRDEFILPFRRAAVYFDASQARACGFEDRHRFGNSTQRPYRRFPAAVVTPGCQPVAVGLILSASTSQVAPRATRWAQFAFRRESSSPEGRSPWSVSKQA